MLTIKENRIKTNLISDDIGVGIFLHVDGCWPESCLLLSESVVETWASLFAELDP